MLLKLSMSLPHILPAFPEAVSGQRWLSETRGLECSPHYCRLPGHWSSDVGRPSTGRGSEAMAVLGRLLRCAFLPPSDEIPRVSPPRFVHVTVEV